MTKKRTAPATGLDWFRLALENQEVLRAALDLANAMRRGDSLIDVQIPLTERYARLCKQAGLQLPPPVLLRDWK